MIKSTSHPLEGVWKAVEAIESTATEHTAYPERKALCDALQALSWFVNFEGGYELHKRIDQVTRDLCTDFDGLLEQYL